MNYFITNNNLNITRIKSSETLESMPELEVVNNQPARNDLGAEVLVRASWKRVPKYQNYISNPSALAKTTSIGLF